MRIIFLDVETTGVEKDDRLCQLAYKAVDLDGHWLMENHMFKPPVPMSVEAMAVCHITNKMLEDKAPFIGSDVFKRLQDLFNEEGTILVAHNAQFDMKFLQKEGLILPKKHVCTLKIAHDHDKEGELKKHTLQFLRYLHELEFTETINPHDALSDVLVLEGLFKWFLTHYKTEEMVEISSKPILLKKMMFGKYKGEWFKDVVRKDLDYLLWMRRSMEMDENLKYTVEFYINKR